MTKKHFKNFICFVFSIILALQMPATAFAQSGSIDIDAALLEKGYPQIVLDSMDEDAKISIYNEGNIAFSGAVISYYDETDGTFSEITVNEDGSYIAPKGQISPSDLHLSFVCTAVYEAPGPYLHHFVISYSYDWNSLPVWRWQDPIAVSWDSSMFRLTDDSFYKTDKYDGYVVVGGVIVGKVTDQIHSSEKSYAYASNAGVTWYADLKGYIGTQPSRLYGFAEFKLTPLSTYYEGSTTFYGHYVHQKADVGVIIDIDNFGSISVSGGSDYDERGTQKTVSW